MVHPPQERFALLSVFDKTGLVDFAQGLVRHGFTLLSTGGTSRALQEAGLSVVDVSDATQFPEMMGGRVKTLHPMIHGGLLGKRGDKQHQKAMSDHGIAAIDLVAVNLYPFEETVASGAADDTIIENIDIGGPAMIRSAAKNHESVTVIVGPEEYQTILNELDANGGKTTLPTRVQLAKRAYQHTASYDAAIAAWFARNEPSDLPDRFTVSGTKSLTMRYGENPHQNAALYLNGDKRPGVATARLVQGKALSYNNINDADAAFELVSSFDPSKGATVAIIKHANPCGVAKAQTLKDAYQHALRCDPVSAFGGIIATNSVLDAEAADQMIGLFTEVIVAPDATDEAKTVLSRKKNLRLLLTGGLADTQADHLLARTITGGLLVQTSDNLDVDQLGLRVVTQNEPTDDQLEDLRFAFKVAKYVKSNAIVYAKDGATVGIGAGQMNRRDSSRIAASKAAEAAELAGFDQSLAVGSVVASDAFFPFPDGLLAAAEAGAKAVIQPGGSKRDSDVIAAADDAGLAMVFTGARHFRH